MPTNCFLKAVILFIVGQLPVTAWAEFYTIVWARETGQGAGSIGWIWAVGTSMPDALCSITHRSSMDGGLSYILGCMDQKGNLTVANFKPNPQIRVVAVCTEPGWFAVVKADYSSVTDYGIPEGGGACGYRSRQSAKQAAMDSCLRKNCLAYPDWALATGITIFSGYDSGKYSELEVRKAMPEGQSRMWEYTGEYIEACSAAPKPGPYFKSGQCRTWVGGEALETSFDVKVIGPGALDSKLPRLGGRK